MSSNGELLDERELSLLRRARNIFTPSPRRAAKAPDPVTPTKEERIVAALHGWSEAAPDEFFSLLDTFIEEARAQSRTNIAVPQASAYWLGLEDAFINLKQKFNAWKRGTTPDGAPQGE